MKTFTNSNARDPQQAVTLARAAHAAGKSASFVAGGSDLLALVKERIGPSVPVVIPVSVQTGVDQGFVNVFDCDDGLGRVGLGAGGCLLRHVLSLE